MKQQLIHVWIFILYFLWATMCENEEARLRNKAPYRQIFSENGRTVAIFVSCSSMETFKKSIRSFFFFNTQPLRKLKILHCGSVSKYGEYIQMLPQDYDKTSNFVDVVMQPSQNKYSLVKMLQYTLLEIQGTADYIYISDTKWEIKKGQGFIEQAISILKYSEETKQNISQVVTAYPYWRISASLGSLQWTPTGQTYHKILSLHDQSFRHFTLSPSVFNYKTLFFDIFDKQLNNICSENCESQKIAVHKKDQCCIWALGKKVERSHYKMAYLNDGTSLPNCAYISSQ